jgi:DNA-binding FadR family transcriptional regulator
METMSITFASPGSAQRSLKQHEKLVECIRNGDVEGARRNVRETALRARERLMEGLGSPAENVDSAVASPHEIE